MSPTTFPSNFLNTKRLRRSDASVQLPKAPNGQEALDALRTYFPPGPAAARYACMPLTKTNGPVGPLVLILLRAARPSYGLKTRAMGVRKCFFGRIAGSLPAVGPTVSATGAVLRWSNNMGISRKYILVVSAMLKYFPFQTFVRTSLTLSSRSIHALTSLAGCPQYGRRMKQDFSVPRSDENQY